MVLLVGALRAQLWSAGVNIAKFLLGALLGIVVLLSGCTVVAGGTTAVTMFGFVSAGLPNSTNAGGGAFGPCSIPSIQLGGGFVSDADRYVLATTAGWTGENAIISVAVSLTEDPSGDPAAEHVNNDGSIDKGLWQINSGLPVSVAPAWVPWGGRQALADPSTNAWAAYAMWTTRGFQPWTTYTSGLYLKNMARARAAAGATVASITTDVFPLPGWSGQINLHWGIAAGGSDLFAPRGQPIVSVSAGRVVESGWDRVGGNAVLILGADGLQYYYAHMDSAPLVSRSQQVGPGTPLGQVGNTGDADRGPTHLHIGIGHTILLGADAFGGTGSGFDAVSFLRQLYAQMHAQMQAGSQGSAIVTPPATGGTLSLCQTSGG